ncbi:PAS domain S-box protein [Azoarcus sp. TTM-91]|uniref:PAS domain S-box protein n=1 Tax=Azoarcus sp. TTM-91 TaxID=2691581 RepID=UPI00145F9B1F|nr:PAS domain S-box protein [Azoarcus sp. TTM-91]NMG34090.1 PAS domain S-box protein [Azoarcus sp. TTM-91]
MDEMTPDQVEQDQGEELGDGVPARGYRLLPVVGLGGSAGGIEALRAFFKAMPDAPGPAFVVVLHLSPDHESRLAELLQRDTSMPVVQVREAMKIRANMVYVIPPGKALRSMDGMLQLTELPQERHKHVAVDLFFRTLADSHGPHATAIVLSGADGDGAIGLKRVKERGGLTIAQDPEEAQVASMPRTAISTGMVDWVLPVAQMPSRVLQYLRLEQDLRLPPENPAVPRELRVPETVDEAALRDVLTFLRSRTGRDFSDYKRATIVRRIGRRMQVNNIESLPGYLDCLRTRPGESGALLQDLLISVTNFFRDGECFETLEAHLPRLFFGKTASDTVRVWVAGCATGEEAYSLAILLAEFARTLEAPPVIQVFGTDLDDDAIRVAREGIYPTTIEADVSDERLRRYFVKEHRGYRVRRELRETVLFAVHDVLRDSPFSRLDLVSCRNLLIYLNREAQARVLDTFNFALLPGGTLFLGSSESVEDGNVHFAVIDKKFRLYAQRQVPHGGLQIPTGSNTLTLAMEAQTAARSGPVIPYAAAIRSGVERTRTAFQVEGRTLSWAEVHLKLLEHISPPSLLVDAEHEIVHMSATAGRYLKFSGGELTRNLLRLIHPALRIELRGALYQASNTGLPARVRPATLEFDGDTVHLAIEVRPMTDVAPGFLVVVMHALPNVAELVELSPATPQRSRPETDTVADQLDREVERLKTHLRDTVEQYEASTEELKASNEELQAMNEELRSATEELETNREELQSINEELTTVNHELKSKVEELGNANSDIQNLMDATAIATVFLDRELRITRYTPSAVGLFNLIATDVGRPLGHLRTQLHYPELAEDARKVLERLTPIEREVDEAGGNWYLVRVLPYRTLDDRIAGVVLTFVDISDRKQGREALRRSEERFSAIVNQATVGVVQVDLQRRITFSNRCYSDLLGYTQDELVGVPLLDLVHPQDRERSAGLMEKLASNGESFQVETRCLRKDGSIIWLHNSMNSLADADGRPMSYLAVCSDVSERKHAEDALRDSTEKLRLIVENAVEYAIFSTDLERRITTWSTGAERLLGYSEADAVGQLVDMIFTEEDRAAGAPAAEAEQALHCDGVSDDRLHECKDGRRFWASGALMPMHDNSGQAVGFVKILRDQSEQRAAQQALEESRAELLAALKENENATAALQAADEAKDRFLAVLSHELRNPLASISSASEVLSRNGVDAEKRDNAVLIVRRQTQAMKVLLDDLLDVSRLRLGRLALQKRWVRFAHVVESALETARHVIDAAGHELEVRLPGEAITLYADPVRLSQVLANLLTNAAKYTPECGCIKLSAERAGDRLVIAVEDNGIGMEPDAVEQMFEMFSQSPDAGSRSPHGLGIGLALVRSIVQLHGGSVRGESAGKGLGSRFIVEFPLTVRSAEEESAADQHIAVGGKRRVLLVDDNADAIWAVARLLDRHEVATASSGREALRMASELQPEVIVLDLGLPDLSGLEVARAIRAEKWGRQALLVASTGWGREKDRKKVQEAGFDAHLVKPLDIEELKLLIAGAPKGRE